MIIPVTVKNTGTGRADDVVLFGESGSEATLGGKPSYFRTLGPLGVGEVRTLRVKSAGWKRTGEHSFPFRASADGSAGDEVICAVEVLRPEFSLHLKANRERVLAGSEVEHSIRVKHTGATSLADLEIFDELDPRSRLVMADGGGIV